MICHKINIVTKEIKKKRIENTTSQQMKTIDNLNQTSKVSDFWKPSKILLIQNQKNNKHLNQEATKNQEAAYAENLKTKKKTNESKYDKGKYQEQIVSLKMGEKNFKAIKLSEQETKHREVKPVTLKYLLTNRKNNAPGHEEIRYQMIKQLPLEPKENLSKTIQTSKQLGHGPAQ